jgi:cytochrome c-type biogenesis protein CcmH/NrfG
VRKDSIAFLIVGFALGFAVLYFATGQRAEQIVRATPRVMSPDELSARSQPAPAPPPLDQARVRQLEDQVRANPQDFDALVELGNIWFDQMRYPEATSLYMQALQLRPDSVGVRTDMATTMFYSQNFDGAIAEFRKSLEFDPTSPQALFNLGVAYLHGKNDPASALQSWEKLVATNPNHPQTEMVKQQIAAVKAQMQQPTPSAP